MGIIGHLVAASRLHIPEADLMGTRSNVHEGTLGQGFSSGESESQGGSQRRCQRVDMYRPPRGARAWQLPGSYRKPESHVVQREVAAATAGDQPVASPRV